MSNVPNVDVECVREINAALPLRKISEQIDRFALSADAKSLVMDLAHVTVSEGSEAHPFQTLLGVEGPARLLSTGAS